MSLFKRLISTCEGVVAAETVLTLPLYLILLGGGAWLSEMTTAKSVLITTEYALLGMLGSKNYSSAVSNYNESPVKNNLWSMLKSNGTFEYGNTNSQTILPLKDTIQEIGMVSYKDPLPYPNLTPLIDLISEGTEWPVPAAPMSRDAYRNQRGLEYSWIAMWNGYGAAEIWLTGEYNNYATPINDSITAANNHNAVVRENRRKNQGIRQRNEEINKENEQKLAEYRNQNAQIEKENEEIQRQNAVIESENEIIRKQNEEIEQENAIINAHNTLINNQNSIVPFWWREDRITMDTLTINRTSWMTSLLNIMNSGTDTPSSVTMKGTKPSKLVRNYRGGWRGSANANELFDNTGAKLNAIILQPSPGTTESNVNDYHIQSSGYYESTAYANFKGWLY